MKKILFLFIITVSILCRAQNPGDVVQNFGLNPEFDFLVNSTIVQFDSKILVGGNFRTYNGTSANRIIRLNTDGTKDTTFNSGTGFNDNVNCIAVQSDGKILVGGSFTSYNGISINKIIRLNTNGTIDASFALGTGFNDNVNSIAVQTDSKILVGGSFTSYNGVTENRIIRLNVDGTKDTSFNTGNGFNSFVRCITIQSDGKIIAGGLFNSYKSVTENFIIRLHPDGTKDTSFNIGTGFDASVNSIVVQSNGKILVGGNFSTYKGLNQNYIIRLNTDGSKDTTFNPGTGFDSYVFSLALQTDGKVLVGGLFSSYNGTTANKIIRLNTNGTKDTSFNTGTGFNMEVNSIAIQSDGKILSGGYFTNYNGTVSNMIIRLNTNATKDSSFNAAVIKGFNNNVRSAEVQPDGKIVLGGWFTSYKEVVQNYITRINADGTKDASFNTGTGFNANGYVNTIKLQSDGKILVGGYFSTYNGTNQNYIIRLNADGTKDTTFNTGTGFDFYVFSLAVQADGKILVGGWFTSYNGVTQNRIIRLNADGTKDTSFNTGTGFNNNGVNCFAIQPDGKILVGGYFTTYNGVGSNMIIRLNTDGTKDTSFNTGTGFDYAVHSITIQSDGKILVGGAFVKYKGTAEKFIIRLNTDGTKDTTFNTGTGFNGDVYAITLLPYGKILVGGYYTNYNGTTENRLICLNNDGTKDVTFNIGTGFNNSISTIKILNNEKILVGGWFTTYKDNNESAMLIALHSGINLTNEDFNDLNTFKLYPNPAKDNLYIQSGLNASVTSIEIFDLLVKLHQSATGNIVNVSNLPAGLYIAKIKTEKGEFTKRFIKE
jgi:uncharacterized delta-60 repeat protein